MYDSQEHRLSTIRRNFINLKLFFSFFIAQTVTKKLREKENQRGCDEKKGRRVATLFHVGVVE